MSASASQSDDWFSAASAGDTLMIRKLLDVHADINEKGSSNMTPLMIASFFGKTDVVEILLRAHANTNLQSGSGLTALMIASQKGHSDIVQLLLNAGAKKNLKSSSGTTALMYAAELGYQNITALLKIQEKTIDVLPVPDTKAQKPQEKPRAAPVTKRTKKSVAVAMKNPVVSSADIASVPTITDADGNVYHTVKIGTQTWLTENFRTTKYNDGTDIPLIIDGNTWGDLSSPGYCWYNNDATHHKSYGILYNWYAVVVSKFAPPGWHVPSDADWIRLENYLIANGYNYDGTTSGNLVAKSLAAQTGWFASAITGTLGNNLSSNNRSGFSALPAGYRDNWGSFDSLGNHAGWWSAQENDALTAYCSSIKNGHADAGLEGHNFSKRFGFSVRLVKDK
jgi:uncharacterized protein (TIGR02145 family)